MLMWQVAAAVGVAAGAAVTSGWASRRSSGRRCQTGVCSLLYTTQSKHIRRHNRRLCCAVCGRHCSSVTQAVTLHLQAGRQVRGLPAAAQQRLLRHDWPQQVPRVVADMPSKLLSYDSTSFMCRRHPVLDVHAAADNALCTACAVSRPW